MAGTADRGCPRCPSSSRTSGYYGAVATEASAAHQALDNRSGPWIAERWAELGGFIEGHPGIAFPVTEEVLRSGAAAEYNAASVFQAMHKLQVFKLEARKLLKEAVLVLPTTGGTWTREQVREDPIATNSQMGLYTNHCNLLDLCAVALPAGEAGERLPFGISAFTPAEEEGRLRAFARHYTRNEGGRG